MSVLSASRGSGCLFCGSTVARSTADEHVEPYALGNSVRSGLVVEETVLKVGETCDKCNRTRVGRNDDALVAWPPISVMRTLALVENRKKHLVDAVQGTAWSLRTLDATQGTFRLSAVASTADPVALERVARALAKIALERWSLQDRADARSARWDPVARMALGEHLPDRVSLGLRHPAGLDELDPTPESIVGLGPQGPDTLMCRSRLVGLSSCSSPGADRSPCPTPPGGPLIRSADASRARRTSGSPSGSSPARPSPCRMARAARAARGRRCRRALMP